MTEKENNLGRFASLPSTLNLPQMKAGEVWLVGAGPGEVGLLTLHALNGLQQADVVLYDSLISPAVLALSKAELIYVGKQKGLAKQNEARKQKDISNQLIELAKAGKKVLRLKGGDPGIFGRGGEEATALRQAGVRVSVFAGVSAALAAAHRAEVVLTHRENNQTLTFLTGHEPHLLDWQALLAGGGVLAIYMPQDYAALQKELLGAGKDPTEEMIIVSHAGIPEKEEVRKVTLGQLDKNIAPPPAIIIIGAKEW